ncbi:MAG: ATP-dependent acyl-CoA ligase [Chloroflexi bacterium]|nr:ATP-dependent acyl-CoA ligase [Chloroflexota bacterium]
MSTIIGPDQSHRLMWEMSLGELLDAAAAQNPNKPFVEISGRQITYHQFVQAAMRTAGMFQELGIGKGDRVCLLLPNCPEVLYCWFGLSLIGAIAVPINTAYKKNETATILNDADAEALVAHESFLSVAAEAAELAPNVRLKIQVGGDGAPEPGWTSLENTMAQTKQLSSRPDVSPQDISMLVYTSGTTGSPKGVQITHQMYVAAGQGFAHWTQATQDDRFFTCLPYFHANAQYYSTMGTLAVGATLTVVDRFSASRFWDQVRDSQATVVNFIGMMLPVLAKQPESPTDRQHRVRLLYGSPAFSPELLETLQQRFGVDIIVGFGMTETCYGTIEGIRQPRRPGSSGLPRQHPDPHFVNQIRIVDGTAKPAPPNTVGEITIKNPAVTPGYWRNEEQTRLALRDGWLYTGDLGWLDDDGFLYFVDRKKDIIRRRGENISSQEVEDVMKRHPKVLDCAMIAVPSELGEDEIKAYVIPRPGSVLNPEELVYWCAENLANFKVPRYIEMRDELPRTPSLRVRKDLLRQERDNLTQGCFDREKAGIRLR